MKTVLIVTGQHFAEAPRKVDLHFIADALNAGGNHVDFLTMRLSWLSRWAKDGRWEYAQSRQKNRWVELTPLQDEFIWYSRLHPVNLKNNILNTLSGALFRHFGKLLPQAVLERLPGYTHILIESGAAPLLTPVIRARAPQARIIYHAADRLRTIGAHPCIESFMAETINNYDAAHIMAEALRDDIPAGVPVLYMPHGIDKDSFDREMSNPYPTERNVVSVGDMLFDASTVDALARSYPDWHFHLFGKKALLENPPANVITHGEKPFDQLVPYIRFADIGLAPYRENRDADYLSQSSLKMIQYTYCRLPIVAPHFAAAGRNHVLSYTPENESSIRDAFDQAVSYDRTRIDPGTTMSWAEKTEILFA